MRGGQSVKLGRRPEPLSEVDAVVFDCDGVLIDARRSYDETIRVVVEAMVKESTGKVVDLRGSAPLLISRMRRTGGFNNDWDMTYALTLFSVAALDGRARPSGLDEMVERFGAEPRKKGAEAADAFLEQTSRKADLQKARERMGYPGTPPESRMATLFDEIYFGSSLFKKIRGLNPEAKRRGLIELERVLVREGTLERLSSILGGRRLAIATGRPYLGTKHTLGGLMDWFDKEASTFIGDADIFPELARTLAPYRKPSGAALLRARDGLSSRALLYVGDSAEDLMMVKDAERSWGGARFAGVYQTSPDPEKLIRWFEGEGSDVVIKSVNEVPRVLARARR
jgi:HAD superfamily phosphatase